MQNRLKHAFDEGPTQTSAWQIDAQPAGRLAWLFVGISLPILLIAARLVMLQTRTPDHFLAPFEETVVRQEPIPTHNGRILGRDGRVLAEDRQRLSLHGHYRWLEDPPDKRWLRQQALEMLTRRERRDPLKVAAAERDVLRRRQDMWSRLAQLTKTRPENFTRIRADIQTRVERIVASVQRRREQHTRQSDPLNARASQFAEVGQATQQDAESTKVSWLKQVWQTLKREMTTAPPRRRNDPVIVQEELTHHLLLDNIPLDVAAVIEAHPQRFPGLRVETVSHRHYPAGRLAAHIVGARTPLRGEEFQKRQANLADAEDPLHYAPGDLIGRNGVEKSYDDQLRGIPGLRKVTLNRRGEILSTEVLREPRPGRDVVLSLHLDLQQRLQRLLATTLQQQYDAAAREAKSKLAEARPAAHASAVPQPVQTVQSQLEKSGVAAAGGAIVVLDIRTGDVLASVSAPDFRLQDLQHPDPKSWNALISDPRRPFFNRVTAMAIPPGSVFKAVTAIAMLEDGRFDPDQPLACRGYLSRPDRHRCYIYRHFGVGHGGVTLRDALAQSCNVYFYQVAREMGAVPIANWARRLGLGRPTGIDVPGEKAGHVPRPPIADGVRHAGYSSEQARWYPGDTLGLAIGQSRLTTTPLQIARVMAAIASDGELVTPRVVHQVMGTSTRGSLRQSQPMTMTRLAEATVRLHGLSTDTLSFVREGLLRVVEHPRGTAHKSVFLTQLPIAGKTGTAEVGGGRADHAWFAGYAPADAPKVAFVVVLEHAGSGGRVAGPLARDVVQSLLDFQILSPSR